MIRIARPWKLTLLAVAALAGLLTLAAAVVLLLARPSRLEALASKALRMEVDIVGGADFTLSPGLHLTLEDVHVRNRGGEVVSAERADFDIDLLPLLLTKVRFNRIVLERYRISIERDIEGSFNYEPEVPRDVAPTLDLPSVFLADGSVHYLDTQTGGEFEATDCDMDVTDVRHPGGSPPGLLRRLSLTMQFVCSEMRRDDLVLADVRGSVDGTDGVFEFEPVTLLVFGGQGSGSFRLDRTGPVPRVEARYSVLKFRIEEFLNTLSPEQVAHGPLDFSMELTMQGATWDELRQTADGVASVVGENLTLDGRNLDKDLSRYASSQNFNLVDVGGLFLAGPLGLTVTKGYSFASLFRGSGGSTRIRTLVSEWKVERGVAVAQDVALTTNENRLALQGRLDFVDEEFEGITVAVVDPDGCAYVRQRISGPFAKPVLEKPNFLKAVAGPAIGLFQRVRGLFPHEDCEVFYAGSVAHPQKPKKSDD